MLIISKLFSFVKRNVVPQSLFKSFLTFFDSCNDRVLIFWIIVLNRKANRQINCHAIFINRLARKRCTRLFVSKDVVWVFNNFFEIDTVFFVESLTAPFLNMLDTLVRYYDLIRPNAWCDNFILLNIDFADELHSRNLALHQ